MRSDWLSAKRQTGPPYFCLDFWTSTLSEGLVSPFKFGYFSSGYLTASNFLNVTNVNLALILISLFDPRKLLKNHFSRTIYQNFDIRYLLFLFKSTHQMKLIMNKLYYQFLKIKSFLEITRKITKMKRKTVKKLTHL